MTHPQTSSDKNSLLNREPSSNQCDPSDSAKRLRVAASFAPSRNRWPLQTMRPIFPKSSFPLNIRYNFAILACFFEAFFGSMYIDHDRPGVSSDAASRVSGLSPKQMYSPDFSKPIGIPGDFGCKTISSPTDNNCHSGTILSTFTTGIPTSRSRSS